MVDIVATRILLAEMRLVLWEVRDSYRALRDLVETRTEEITVNVQQVKAQSDALFEQATENSNLLQSISTAMQAGASALDAANATIADLKAQIATGNPVTDAQLDEISAVLTNTSDTLTSMRTAENVLLNTPAEGQTEQQP